jgi:hypothetical protein
VKRLQILGGTAVSFDSYLAEADTTRMRTRIMFALAVTTALICPAAHAAEWLSLSKTSDDHATETFIDMSSVVLKDNIRTVRTKFVLLSPRNDNERRIAFGILRMSFDCKGSLAQAGSIEIHYTDTGRLGFIDTHRSWKPADEPLTQKLLGLVCALKNPANSNGNRE